MQDFTRGTNKGRFSGTAMDTEFGAVSFTERMLASDGFLGLFREGMGLVEETAAYLDGNGRADSKTLDRSLSLAYASESMRLTTRLMQLTSWLLLQRAVNEGELTRSDAEREHRRVIVATQDSPIAPDVFGQLPETLRELIARSKRLQNRIQRIDSELKGEAEVAPNINPIASQLDLLAEAFKR